MVDFVELSLYVQEEGSLSLSVDIVLADYDVRSAREHLKRFREVVLFPNPSYIYSSKEGEEGADGAEEDTEGAKDGAGNGAGTPRAVTSLPTEADLVKPIRLSQFYEETLFRVGHVDPHFASASYSAAASLHAPSSTLAITEQGKVDLYLYV